jgi:hypothetical protein
VSVYTDDIEKFLVSHRLRVNLWRGQQQLGFVFNFIQTAARNLAIQSRVIIVANALKNEVRRSQGQYHANDDTSLARARLCRRDGC